MTRPRRVVLAVTTPMAVNLLARPQVEALVSSGYRVHLMCSEGPVDDDLAALASGVSFIPMARAIAPAADVRAIQRTIALLRRLRPDAVVGSTPKAALVSMLAARAARVRLRVFQVRGARWDGVTGRDGTLLRAADRLTARAATDVLAVSRSLAALLVDDGIVRERPVVLGNGGSKGVDTTVFTPDPTRVMDPNAPVLGFAGRLSIDKGIADVVAVADALRGDRPGLRLQVAGAVDPAQPIPPDLERALERYEWLGTVSRTDMPATMRGWDLLVFPSVREGLPNVVIEAAACGVPTVGWDVTGVRDAVREGDSGLLVPAGDRRALIDAAALALQPADHARMRAGGLSWVRSTFDSRSLQEAFVAYLDAAGRARGAW